MATTANRRNTAVKEAMTKSQLLEALSESTGLQRKDVSSVIDQLGVVIERHVKRRREMPGLRSAGCRVSVRSRGDGGEGTTELSWRVVV